MPLTLEIHPTRAAAERRVADELVALLRARPDAVLGLATGDTPTGVYAELVRRARAGELDCSRARTFNLDEYCGLGADDPRSFRSWMRTQLFEPARFAPENVHLPDGGVPPAAREAEAARYERALGSAGGIDLQLVGIGRNGHVGFNEPGSPRDSRTRVVELHPWTRADATARFGALERVPTHAITIGIATILAARTLRVLAFGAHKAELVARTLASAASSDWPASFLHEHPDARLVLDRDAARAL